jgi:hypothetical protein
MFLGGEEGGINICGYVLIRMSKMGLCVSVCVSFNCNAFLVKLYIWTRLPVCAYERLHPVCILRRPHACYMPCPSHFP